MTKRLHDLKRGFTLVELLIVIIIIAVLAAVAIPKFANSSQKSKESALRAELKLMRSAIEMFKNDNGGVPNELADLAKEIGDTPKYWNGTAAVNCTAGNYKGPYMSSINKDPVDSSQDFAYVNTTGKVSAGAAGNDSNGKAFSTY
jgi:type II secretion system protein G